ncbi:MAG: SufD family Fe-S cluster assembly protein [Clostridia bacterium]|nr:SufD family Fe-S cluster assembly protein [Clostridia bacterium]
MNTILKVNETPVRTSRNFHINNIKLENVNVPMDLGEFKNVQISGKTADLSLDKKLAYGLGSDLEKQVEAGANFKAGFELENEDKQLVFAFDKYNPSLVDNISVIAREGSRATVIIRYEARDNTAAFHNGVIRLNAEANANVKVIVVNLLSSTSQNFLAIENTLAENARVTYTMVDFGGKNSVTNYYSDLQGKLCENELNTIYLEKDDELLDLNYIVHLRGERSNANIEVQGALKDNAKKNFKGTIDFKTGCKKAKGNENEACLMLSDTARSLALPMLLCSEEDVEGSHSTSSGKAEQKELFYIMSRGFSFKEAMKLLVRARFNGVLESIENDDLREQILKEIDERLD